MGRKNTEFLVAFVKSIAKNEIRSFSGVFLTKEDKVDLIERISDTKGELVQMISDTKSELTERINSVHTGLIKWMVALWLSSTALIITVLKFL